MILSPLPLAAYLAPFSPLTFYDAFISIKIAKLSFDGISPKPRPLHAILDQVLLLGFLSLTASSWNLVSIAHYAKFRELD